ncbi:MAG: ABC transporter ATP-binding protein [Clostridia bacterium]|nr:ABC transporter ATP-binding protein [Clostridia bacterium]
MLGEVLIDLKLPKIMSKIIDTGVVPGNMDNIKTLGIQMLIYVLIGGITGLSAAFFSSYAAQSFGRDLRQDAYSKVMSLSLEQTDKFTTGSLVTRLTNDITMCQDLVAMIVRIFIRSPMMFIGGIINALLLDSSFAIVLAISMPIQIVFVFLILRKASPMFTKVQKKLDRVNAVVQENVNGARVVKACVKEDHETGRFGEANSALRDQSMSVMMLISRLSPIMMIILNLSVIAIIYLGGLRVQAAKMEVGVIIAGITYVTQILMSMMMVGMMFNSISRASASSKRICEVLECEPVVKDGKGCADCTAEGSVRFENVSFRYPETSGRPVLSNVDLEVKKGEYVAILGATGSGKTSLVNLITRFYDTNEGTVYVDGEDVRNYALDDLRSKTAYVLQKSELFAGTVYDNIRFGRLDATDEECEHAARIAQADEFIREFKDGYNTWIDEKGASLSGGQKQRISIARAILRHPEIIIFDDSTSALDIGTEARLRAALRTELADTTIIMIAQRVASVMQADRIAVLERGKITACAPHDELMKTSETYQDIYHSQLKGGEEL